MKGSSKVTLIAICRDGGTKLVEYKNKAYFIFTNGEVHHTLDGSTKHSHGQRVHPDLEKEIKQQFINE